MRPENVIPAVVFGLLGLGFIAIGVPLVRRGVAPGAFGLRTGETLDDSETWYAANRYSGRDFIVLGSLLCAYAVVSVLWRPVRDIETNMLLLMAASVAGGLTIAIRGWLFGIRYLAAKRKRLQRDVSPEI